MPRLSLLFILFSLFFSPAGAQETERLYLSGHGCDDMVEWDFKCTDGRNSGEWTKIGVPSCWELQGFGTYQYGMRFYGKATPEGIADEHGLYKTEFTLPQAWQGRQIQLVFEAVFTEARVTINGRKAGAGTYQGGFTRHTIDVSDRVFFGLKKKNRLEVEVLKESTNPQVNLAERRADYWNFGGIWRPVFVVAKPMQNISRVAIDAKGDGRFMADVFLSRALPGCSVCVDLVDTNGTKMAASSVGGDLQSSVGGDLQSSVGGDLQSPTVLIASDNAHFAFTVKNVKPWNAEQPTLYTAVFTLKDAGGKTLHVERQKFGFRTIEYRHSYAQQQPSRQAASSHVYGGDDDGVFINGQKVIMKGVNRHSFRPETGRTLSKAKNIEDVKLIKSMNMNAVRLSHYPADPEFLDACDSLGLYVECELPGWHWPHETVTGSQIAEEMVTRDVNHPSIIFWSNGNEGGFNYDIEPVFTKLDPQQRVVLYPWANRNGFETKHYRSWGETADYMRQKEIFMPTEFLHGLYDGGHGAGLSDYWKLMMANPRCAGGFLWDLMDQAVFRTDWANTVQPNSQFPILNSQYLDPVGNFGSDGIVGPHMEKEGSYYTIREVWSPIQVAIENGKLRIENHYDFTNLKACRFTYQYLTMPAYGDHQTAIVGKGILPSPDVPPGGHIIIAAPIVGEASKLCAAVGEASKLCAAVGEASKLCEEVGEASKLCAVVGEASKLCEEVGEASKLCAAVGEASKLCSSVLQITATDPYGNEVFTWNKSITSTASPQSLEASPTTAQSMEAAAQSLEASPTAAQSLEASPTAAQSLETSAQSLEASPTAAQSLEASPTTAQSLEASPTTMEESDDELTVKAGTTLYTFSKHDGRLQSVTVVGGSAANTSHFSFSGPRFVAAKRSDRSQDGFYNHDDKQAFEKKTQYTEYEDQGAFAGFEFNDAAGGDLQSPTLTARYRHGSMAQAVWAFAADGTVCLTVTARFNGVVDLMGICFDYPEDKVRSKRWVGCGPYRVWQNRIEGPQYGYYETDYNDPVPGESWQYPEFKGYFADVAWMQIETTEGRMGIEPDQGSRFEVQGSKCTDDLYIGVFTPRDGRDHLLYDLPQTGLSLLRHIPAVRNKVNTTDLNGPSAQPHFVSGEHVYSAILHFE